MGSPSSVDSPSARALAYALDGSGTLKSIWTGMTRFQVSAFLQIMVKLTIGAALVLGRGATIATLRQARYWVKKWRAWPYEPDEDRAHQAGQDHDVASGA